MLIRDRIVELRRVPARSLIPHPRNWRKHPKAQADALRGVLAEVGYADALIARETPDGLQLIDGHLRAETTPDQEVPVLVLDVTEAEADKLLASLDPLAAMAGTDEDLLRELIAGIETESDALQALFDELASPDPADGLTDPDDIPEPPAEATTIPGDLWILGEHRLLCGDSSSPEDLDRLLDGAPVHLLNTDPPYNVHVAPRSNNAIASGSKSLPRVAKSKSESQGFDLARYPSKSKPTHSQLRPKDRALVNDYMSDEEFDLVIRAWFGNAARVLEPGRSFYIWGGYANWANYCPAMEEVGLRFAQGIVWAKGHPVLGRKDMMNDCEFAWYGWREGAGHKWLGPPNITNVWSVKKVNPQSMIHLTEKPVELATRAIEYSSRRGENVLDLFGGSGSTLIGCEQTERRAFLMELDPLYADVIVARYEAFSGKKAVLASS